MNNLLREYIQVLLSEGAWDDAIKKSEQSPDPSQHRTKEFSEYKRVGIHPKFIPLFLKTKNAYWNTPEIWKEITREWEEIAKKNLPGFEKDVTKYPDALALVDAVENSKNLVSKTQLKSKAKTGSKTLFKQDGWTVVSVQTKEASCAYGTGTKWCISATQSQNHFDAYDKEQKVNFYFVLGGGTKFAIAVYPQEIEGKVREYYDAQDNNISEEQFREELENLGAPLGLYQVIGVKPEHGDLDPTKNQVQQRPLLIDTDPVEWLQTTNSVPGMSGDPDTEPFPTSKFMKALPALAEHLRTNADPETHDLERFRYYLRKLLRERNVSSRFTWEDTTLFLGFIANQMNTRDALLYPGEIKEEDLEWLRFVRRVKDPRTKVLETLTQSPETLDDPYLRALFRYDLHLTQKAVREYISDTTGTLDAQVASILYDGIDMWFTSLGLSQEELVTLFKKSREIAFIAARTLQLDGPAYDSVWSAMGSRSIPPASREELARVHQLLQTGNPLPENDPWVESVQDAAWWTSYNRREVLRDFFDPLSTFGYDVWTWLAAEVLKRENQ